MSWPSTVFLLSASAWLLATGCVTRSSNESADCCTTNQEASGIITDKSLYQVSSTWRGDDGKPIELGALRGRVQVVVMFFASCQVACPILVHDLKRLEASLSASSRSHVGFTLVTIDTERDTPEALHAYRVRQKLSAARWTLLCGTPDDTLELAALLGVKFKKESTGQFAHSNLITVLNMHGEIVHQLAGLNQDLGATVSAIERAVGSR